MTTLWVGVGGALGSIARYQAHVWIEQRWGTRYPLGTLAVNLLGSFLIAAIMHVSLRTELIPSQTRIALTSGLLGGFTTYSTFNYETFRCFQAGQWGLGLANVAATVLGCAFAGWLGWQCARLVV